LTKEEIEKEIEELKRYESKRCFHNYSDILETLEKQLSEKS